MLIFSHRNFQPKCPNGVNQIACSAKDPAESGKLLGCKVRCTTYLSGIQNSGIAANSCTKNLHKIVHEVIKTFI